ncbi:unnamed protein product, partial [Mesorhabditis belari]|uniref:C-type lectin domain-containing protein n=1 Tax=Mesorhabditis belari TaxID=2138241 RepID=A0AAF3FG93_9BILA
MRLLLIFSAFLGIIKGSFTYFKAADMCQQQNGQLATLHKSADNDAIAQYLSSGLWEEAWIGLQCTTQSDCFWDDGTKFDYSNFNNNPDFSNGKNCLMLKAGLTVMPRFRDVYNGWTPKSCYSATDNALCEEISKDLPGCGDYSEFEGNCYKYQPSAPSWLAAETICAQQGGHLVSIHNILENIFIFNLLKADGVGVAAWIGLYNTANQYYWADSSIVDYYNLAGPALNMDPACYALSTTNLVSPQKWVPESCDNDLPFLCQRTTGSPSPVPPFVPPTTTSTTTTTKTTTTQWTTATEPLDPSAPTLPPIITSVPTVPTVPQANMTVAPTSNTTNSPTFLPRGLNILPL